MTARASGRARGAVVGIVTALLVSACTVGPSANPDVLTEQDPEGDDGGAQQEDVPLPPLGEPGTDQIGWTDCDTEVERRLGDDAPDDDSPLSFSCGTVLAPLDAGNQAGRGILQLSVLKAGTAEDRVPLVVVNDINGEPGTQFAARLAQQLPDELLDTFAVVGIDRRGTGSSEPIDCIPQSTRRDLLDTDVAEDMRPLLDAVRKAGQECALTLGNDQRAYDSRNTAADLEELRRQLGQRALHAVGRGEGSRVLHVYADGYTDNVGRMALDGFPDPARQVETMFEDVAAGAEAALAEFAADCARTDCPLGDEAGDAVPELVRDLRDEPASTDDGELVGPSLALTAIREGLGEPDRWPRLAAAIDDARDGDGDALTGFVEHMLIADGRVRPTVDAALATRCNDSTNRLSPDRLAQLHDQWQGEYPVFGGLVAQRLAWCSQWPAADEELPDPEIEGVPPMLAVSTAADPRTPETGTTRAADRMPRTTRVAWQGAGHGAIGRSDCATDRVTAFLVDGTVPEAGSTCPA